MNIDRLFLNDESVKHLENYFVFWKKKEKHKTEITYYKYNKQTNKKK